MTKVNEVIRDAAVGAALQELLGDSIQLITYVTKRSIDFKSDLKSLKSTLSKLAVLVEDIPQAPEELGCSPGGEIMDLVELVKKGEKLVKECSKLKWWKQSIRFAYADKLRKLDKELLLFLQKDIMCRIMKLVIETSSGDGEAEGSVFHGDPEDAPTDHARSESEG